MTFFFKKNEKLKLCLDIYLTWKKKQKLIKCYDSKKKKSQSKTTFSNTKLVLKKIIQCITKYYLKKLCTNESLKG